MEDYKKTRQENGLEGGDPWEYQNPKWEERYEAFMTAKQDADPVRNKEKEEFGEEQAKFERKETLKKQNTI